MNLEIKKSNICRWLERVFPNGLTEEDKTKLDIQTRRMDDLGWIYRDRENLFAPKIGTIVDMATNFALFGYKVEIIKDVIKAMQKLEEDLEKNELKWWIDPKNNFIRYSKYEYHVMLKEDLQRLNDLKAELEWKGVSDEALRLMNYFVKYLDFARQGYKNFWKTKEADEGTIENIRIMVQRCVFFLQKYFEDVRGGLMFKDSGMCKSINTGSIDFYTNDEMIDIKVKSNEGIWDRDIRQMIVYYMLAKRNGFDFKKCIIFNPRLGEWYEFETKNIPSHLMEEIESKW